MLIPCVLTDNINNLGHYSDAHFFHLFTVLSSGQHKLGILVESRKLEREGEERPYRIGTGEHM